jgi:hypothetical protein
MELTRRQVLGGGAAVAGAAAAGTWAATASSVWDAQPSIPRRALFTPIVGTTLVAHQHRASFEMLVQAVTDLDIADAGAEDRQFMLILETGALAMEDGIYRLVSPELPAVDLFMSRAKSNGSTVTMLAVINRLV